VSSTGPPHIESGSDQKLGTAANIRVPLRKVLPYMVREGIFIFGVNHCRWQSRPLEDGCIPRVRHSMVNMKLLQSRRGPTTMENRRAANLLFFPRSASYVFTSSPATLERNKLNDQILNAIDEEIAKLRQARAILTDAARTPVSKSATTASPALLPKAKTRRKLSAKARKAIADAQRKRWAKVKSQKKAAAAALPVKKEPAAS